MCMLNTVVKIKTLEVRLSLWLCNKSIFIEVVSIRNYLLQTDILILLFSHIAKIMNLLHTF